MNNQSQPAGEKDWNKIKVTFTDCWEFDDRIPADGRWLANIDRVASVAAPTKEKAFEEIIKSLSVLIAHNSGISPSTPNQSDELQEARKEIERLKKLVEINWHEANDDGGIAPLVGLKKKWESYKKSLNL